MDPFTILGAAASIIACIQLTGSLLQRIGPSSHDSAELNQILTILTGFREAYEGLKSCRQFNEKDEARSTMFQRLEEPLKNSEAALGFVQERLTEMSKATFIGHYFVGNFWDKKFKKYLQRLHDAKSLFELALHADQRQVSRKRSPTDMWT
jgi:hypothetical protein